MILRCFMVAVVCAISAGQAAAENWTPTSTTSISLVGPIRFTESWIDFHGGKFLRITGIGMKDVMDRDSGGEVLATVYRVTATGPGGGVLCGGAPVTHVLVWNANPVGSDVKPVVINGFKGSRLVKGGPDDCGAYRYDIR